MAGCKAYGRRFNRRGTHHCSLYAIRRAHTGDISSYKQLTIEDPSPVAHLCPEFEGFELKLAQAVQQRLQTTGRPVAVCCQLQFKTHTASMSKPLPSVSQPTAIEATAK